jgi:hypothetical protein
MKSFKKSIFLILFCNLFFVNVEKINAQLPEIKQLTFVLKTPPLSPEYYREQEFIIKKNKIQLYIKKQNEIVEKSKVKISVEEWNKITKYFNVNKIQIGPEKTKYDYEGCVGGVTYLATIKYKNKEIKKGLTYECGNNQYGNMQGSVRELYNYLKSLFPDFKELNN